jgi:phosphatidylethanolamine/phosphatidyl-N-methylethanolamine N-methyltransferase
MILVERDVALASALELRFGRCKVVGMCLHEAPEVLTDLPPDTTIVSSLPFLSLPAEVVGPTVALLRGFLLQDPRRRLVQYTYGPKRPFDPDSDILAWRREELVLRNLPPAWVWVLQAHFPVTAPAGTDAKALSA